MNDRWTFRTSAIVHLTSVSMARWNTPPRSASIWRWPTTWAIPHWMCVNQMTYRSRASPSSSMARSGCKCPGKNCLFVHCMTSVIFTQSRQDPGQLQVRPFNWRRRFGRFSRIKLHTKAPTPPRSTACESWTECFTLKFLHIHIQTLWKCHHIPLC